MWSAPLFLKQLDNNNLLNISAIERIKCCIYHTYNCDCYINQRENKCCFVLIFHEVILFSEGEKFTDQTKMIKR